MNWKSKLTSRKWWAAITGVIVSVMVLFNVDSQQSERITALITAVSSAVALWTLQPLIKTERMRIMTMNEFEIKEAVKAFAYGFSAERVAEECDIPVEQARAIQQEHSAEIIERRKASYE